MRTKLFGEKAAQDGDTFLRSFDEGFATFLNEQLFGTIWSRPGLPIKLRSLLTMTALMALGRGPGAATAHARSVESRDPA